MERLFSGEMPVRVETIVVAKFSSIPGIWARMLAGAVLILTLPGKISLGFRVQVSNSCGRFSVVTPELYSLLMFPSSVIVIVAPTRSTIDSIGSSAVRLACRNPINSSSSSVSLKSSSGSLIFIRGWFAKVTFQSREWGVK